MSLEKKEKLLRFEGVVDIETRNSQEKLTSPPSNLWGLRFCRD